MIKSSFQVPSVFGGLLALMVLALLATEVVCFSAEALADDLRPSIEKNPLAWLKEDLTCAQLTDQLKARYAPLGQFSGMPDNKKSELRAVLDVICSPKFAYCNFSGCKKLPESGSSVGGGELAATSESLAEQKLSQLVSARERERKQSIQKRSSQEAKGKLQWHKMAMKAEEKLVPTEPRAPIITAPADPVRRSDPEPDTPEFTQPNAREETPPEKPFGGPPP